MPNDSNPRSFVTATGVVFQIAGLVLAGSGCCLWSLSGHFQTQLPAPASSVGDYFQAGHWPRMVEMIDVVVTFGAGLGMLATGLGLQAERRGSGLAALWITAVLAATWWLSLVAYMWGGAWMPQVLIAAVASAACSVFFLLAGNSHRTLKLHPPPRDQNVVTDEFLESLRRNHSSH